MKIFSSLPLLSLNIVIWGIYIGIVAAMIASSVTKRITGRTVRALIDAGAFSPESAAGASALGLKGASARVLCGQLYGKLIFCPNEYYARTVPYDPEKENPYKTPALDMDKAVFYIPEEKKFEAEERFCSRTSPVWSIILYALLLGAAFAALSFAAPKLIGAFTSVFNR